MFIILFNDTDPMLENIISLNFADNKKLASLIKYLDDAIRLQNGIDLFVQWCRDNKLELNDDKCKVMTFTCKKNPIIYEYKIEGVSIKRVYETSDLGVLLVTRSLH